MQIKQFCSTITLSTFVLATGLCQAQPYNYNPSATGYPPANSGYYNPGNTSSGNFPQNSMPAAPTGQGTNRYYNPAQTPPGQYPQGSMQTAPSMTYPQQPVFQQGMMQQPVQQFGNDPVYVVRALPMNSTVKLGGTVIPFKEVTLSAQIPGRIEFIAGSEGDFFEQGQVLVTIDDDDLLAQRRAAVAELGNADAAMRNAQVQYSRELISPQSRNINRSPGMGMPSLFDQFFTRGLGNAMGYGSPGMDRHADLYSRGTAVNQAQARQMRARSKLEEVDAKLRDTRAIAPFSGLIVKKLAEIGDTVQPGQPLLNFADTKALQLQVDVPARLMPGIQPGMLVDARLDVGNKHIQARVAQIFPMADVQRHTVTVKFDLPEGVPGGPGMYAEVVIPNIDAPNRSVILIPKSSVRQRGSLYVVYRLNENNEPVIRYVRIGEQVNDTMVAVLSGLMDNDRILVNPASRINQPPSQTSGQRKD